MATDLTTIFGSEIRVANQPVRSERTYHGWPGAHGLTDMWMGSRGFPIFISGRLRATGASYSAARTALQNIIYAIEAWQFEYAHEFYFGGETFYDTVIERFEILKDTQGKQFHWNSDGYVWCDFIALLISLY